MNILDYIIVPVEVKNIPAFLPECILFNINCSNGLLFSSYATASLFSSNTSATSFNYKPLYEIARSP
jgi:hypothetical protein